MNHINYYFLLFLIAVPFFNIKGQNNIPENYDIYMETRKSSDVEKDNRTTEERISLIIDPKNNIFEIDQTWSGHDYLSSKELMKGTFYKKKNNIICYNIKTKETHLLQVIDESRLINKNLPFIGDTLYIYRRVRNGSNKFLGTWNNGEKDGTWFYYKNNKLFKKEIFANGILIETKFEISKYISDKR